MNKISAFQLAPCLNICTVLNVCNKQSSNAILAIPSSESSRASIRRRTFQYLSYKRCCEVRLPSEDKGKGVATCASALVDCPEDNDRDAEEEDEEDEEGSGIVSTGTGSGVFVVGAASGK